MRIAGLVLLALLTLASRAHAGEVRVHGVVVDEGHHPVPEAQVQIRASTRQTETTTDAEGRFSVPIEFPEAMTQVVLDIRKTVNDRVLRLLGAYDVNGFGIRPLVLWPEKAIDFVVLRDEMPAAGARFAIYTGSRFSRVRLTTARADDDGSLLLKLPPGSYAWRTDDARYGYRGAAFAVPRIPEAIPLRAAYDPRRIVLGSPRNVHVLVVDDVTNAPVSGATLSPSSQRNGWGELFPDQPKYTTDCTPRCSCIDSMRPRARGHCAAISTKAADPSGRC